MTDLPTHKHKKSGDIVFWNNDFDPKEYEKLPTDYWEKTHGEAKRKGHEKGLKEAKFKDWTLEEVATYFEEEISKLRGELNGTTR